MGKWSYQADADLKQAFLAKIADMCKLKSNHWSILFKEATAALATSRAGTSSEQIQSHIETLAKKDAEVWDALACPYNIGVGFFYYFFLAS